MNMDDEARTYRDGRLADLQRLADIIHDGEGTDHDGEHLDADEAIEKAYEYPLSIEAETVVRIVLGTGGPHDEIRMTYRDGDHIHTEYLFVWGTTNLETNLTGSSVEDAITTLYGETADEYAQLPEHTRPRYWR